MESTKVKSVTFEHDDEDHVPDHVHRNLLENIKQIHGKPKITPATRSESAAEVSEFNISSKKRTKSGKSTFHEADLIRSLKKKKPKIAQKLEAAKKTRTLSKPLETVYEKRAQREAGYQSVRTRLSAWNDIVSSNRVADQLSFPLKGRQIEVYDHTDSDLFSSFSNLTPLEQKFQKILNSSETSKEEEKKLEQSKVRLTLKDMIEQRKKFAKIKAHASYQMAKSKRQNRIKSKKYHRILRREKTKQQLKDFELLRKTDPEAALKQLEQLEKSRAQERATLRHRNTGKWARNQLVKAKYNKESREAISEQLTKNRELTEKVDIGRDSSDSDADEDEASTPSGSKAIDPVNAWFGKNEYTEFVDGYKEWSQSKNRSASDSKRNDRSSGKIDDNVPHIMEDVNEDSNAANNVANHPHPPPRRKKVHKNDEKELKFPPVSVQSGVYAEIRNSSGLWTVTSLPDTDESFAEKTPSKEPDVSEMFDLLDEKLERKLDKKLKKVREAEITVKQNEPSKRQHKKSTKKSRNSEVIPAEVPKKVEPIEDDKPQPTTSLEHEVPDLMTIGDEALDDDEEDIAQGHKMSISDALAAEDVVTEFLVEKQKAEDEDKPKIIDTSLPGWGTWTDASSIREKVAKKSKHRQTNKRLLFRIPKAPPRKDSNKGFVIIKEGVSDKFKEHMVSELPYPFTKVKDFEAHIRAPIGRTWLPETAHQQLIAPPIVTKLGTVIEPMDEGELVQRENF